MTRTVDICRQVHLQNSHNQSERASAQILIQILCRTLKLCILTIIFENNSITRQNIGRTKSPLDRKVLLSFEAILEVNFGQLNHSFEIYMLLNACRQMPTRRAKRIYILIYTKISKNLSAKYYQKTKNTNRILKLMKNIKLFLKNLSKIFSQLNKSFLSSLLIKLPLEKLDD